MAGYTYKNNIDIKRYIYKETYINKHIYEKNIHMEKTYIQKKYKYRVDIHINEIY